MHVLWSPFCLECNKYCSTFTRNIESSLIHSLIIYFCLQLIPRCSCNPKLMFLKLSGVCFKITYLHVMKNQSLFSTLKHNIFLIKLVAYAALIVG